MPVLTPSGSGPSPATTTCGSVTSNSPGGTANYVAKFSTTACDIENSLIQDNGTSVWIGTQSPTAFLDVESTTSASGTDYMVRNTTNYTGNSTAAVVGLLAQVETMSNVSGTSIMGSYSRADYSGGQGSTLGYALGAEADVINHSIGTISNAYGFVPYVINEGGNIANGYGVYVASPTNTEGGTISNYKGVYIANPQISGVSGAYALYSAGGPNYFNGYVGIGTATPAANLEVNGTSQFDLGVTFQQPVTFASGQTFPGSGTITGVTAGADLTGGGTSGGVTLNLNTALVPTLAAANTFASRQTLEAGALVGGTNGQASDLLEVQSTPGTDALTVSSNGTVGLGTGSGAHITTPTANMDLAGTITVPANSYATHTFSNNPSFSSPPVCVATPVVGQGGTWWFIYVPSGGKYTSFNLYSNFSSSVQFNYICVGNPN